VLKLARVIGICLVCMRERTFKSSRENDEVMTSRRCAKIVFVQRLWKGTLVKWSVLFS